MNTWHYIDIWKIIKTIWGFCLPPERICFCFWLAATVRRRQWQPTPVLLPGKSHGRRTLVGCSPWGLEESDTTERLHFHFSFSCIGEGNGNPLQCSCLENSRDSGAWWAAVCGVAQSQTRLKWLSSSSSSSYSQASQVALAVKKPPANAGDLRDVGSIAGLISDSGRSPGGGHGTLLQRSCLENPIDRGAWQAVAHRVTKRPKWLSTAVIMRISHFNTMRNGAESGLSLWGLVHHCL